MSTGRDARAWRLMVLTDRAPPRDRDATEVVRAAIAGGADAIQFRAKAGPDRRLFEEAFAVRELCRAAGVAFVVNDRIDLALAVDADGAHVGQEDLPAAVARRLLGPHRLLGVSAATPAQARQAEADGADYLGVGPVFEARSTKPDAGPPIGLAGLAAVCRASRLPALAIGGISPANARDAIAAGAAGVAAISAVVAAADIAAAARALRAALAQPQA
jgi:thiamine-phosphate pyrophosphorylase